MKHHNAKRCAQGCTSSVFLWQGKIENSTNKTLMSQQPSPEGAGDRQRLTSWHKEEQAWFGREIFFFFLSPCAEGNGLVKQRCRCVF